MSFKCKSCGVSSDREDWCVQCGYIPKPKDAAPGKHDWRQQEPPGRPGRLLVQCAKCEVRGTRVKDRVYANGYTPLAMMGRATSRHIALVLTCPGSKDALEKVIAGAELDERIKSAIERLTEVEHSLDGLCEEHPEVKPVPFRMHSAVSHIGDAISLLKSVAADRAVSKKLKKAGL